MNNEKLEELSDKTGMIGADFQSFMLKLQQSKSAPTVPMVPLIPEDPLGTCKKGLQTSYKMRRRGYFAKMEKFRSHSWGTGDMVTIFGMFAHGGVMRGTAK